MEETDKVIGIKEWELQKKKKFTKEAINKVIEEAKRYEAREKRHDLLEAIIRPCRTDRRIISICTRCGITQSDCIRGLLRFYEKWHLQVERLEKFEEEMKKTKEDVNGGESN